MTISPPAPPGTYGGIAAVYIMMGERYRRLRARRLRGDAPPADS